MCSALRNVACAVIRDRSGRLKFCNQRGTSPEISAIQVLRQGRIIEYVTSNQRRDKHGVGPAMSKAAQAFRTISEVAEDLQVQKHVLRFWELKFPQIKPMKRGGGRRYYRPEDVELLRGICNLLHAEGYTIKGVQKILREQGVDTVKFASSETAAETSSAHSKSARGAKADVAGVQARGARKADAVSQSAATAAQEAQPRLQAGAQDRSKASSQASSQARTKAQTLGSRTLEPQGEAGPASMSPLALKAVRSAIAELEACRAMLLAAGASKRVPAKATRRSRAATS